MATPEFHIVIPARMASQRLPGKPLADIAGHPLIRHVYDRACEASAASVVIATDDQRVFDAAESFGADVVMTSPDHPSGSDRIEECARLKGWPDDQIVVNLQGDEPLMPPVCLEQVARLLAEDSSADVATLCWPVDSSAQADDPNVVKVVFGHHGRALYFSRSPVPFFRDPAGMPSVIWQRHIGLYAYRVEALRFFSSAQPGVLETTEKLEQLRFLENGRVIRVARAQQPIPAGVDTPEDLKRVRAQWKNTQAK